MIGYDDDTVKDGVTLLPASQQIRELRYLTGLSQAAFAARYEIPKRTYEAWEMGERTPPAYVVRLLASAVLSGTDKP